MTINITVNGEECSVGEGTTLLSACRERGIDMPTICHAPNLTPVNTCRVCVVEMEGSRTLVPSCSRQAAEGMAISTHSDRVLRSRRMVLELLASSVDLSRSEPDLLRWIGEYGVDPSRHALSEAASGISQSPSQPSASADASQEAGTTYLPPSEGCATVAQPVKLQDNLYVRDYSRCVLCYKCVQACGEEAQNTFAISVADRGFAATISTEFDTPLPDSACVYCGNCIGVCPTGALVFTTEFELREAGEWHEERQEVTRTVCPYCGVGCNLELRTQDETIVRVTSPSDHEVSHGHLCIKGRFGTGFVKAQEQSPND